jgi:hypothetical protein
MKKILSALLPAFILFAVSLAAQHDHSQCSHRVSFTRSALSDTLDAISYEIYLSDVNTTAKTISGITKVLLKSKVDNLETVTLELLDLTTTQVFVNNQPVTFNHQSPFLYITLTESINADEEVLVEVHYEGVPFHEDWGGFHWEGGEYAFNLGVGLNTEPHNLGKAWFPCIDDFQDRAFYEVIATVDNPKKAVSGGTLMETIDNGNGTSTYHWKLHNEIPTYLVSVAIGEYEKVAWDFTSISGEVIPIEIWVKPADTAKVAGSFQTLVPVLEAFEDRFGPYLWERVGYVGAALGAMEHATNIAYPHFSINGNLTYESLMAHELSHHYFGNLVTCATAEDMWLNEGWAVFCEALYRESLYGVQAYKTNMWERHKDVLYSAHVNDSDYLAVYGIPSEYVYGTTVYQKGALMAHTLRYYLGDELFFPAIKDYINEYKNNYASSWDLRDFLGGHSGIDLTDFFDTWIFSPGFPEYSVDSFNVVPSGNDFDVTVFARQKRKGPDAPMNSARFEITFMDAGWNQETRMMQFSGETGVQSFEIPIQPVLAMADLFDKVADATTDKHIIATAPFDYSATDLYCRVGAEDWPAGDSAFIRMTHRWVPPDPMKDTTIQITLSDYRHWRVEALLPESAEVFGSFTYVNSNFLDSELMQNPNDSIGLLYRPDRAADWQPAISTKFGSANVGFFLVPELLPGEYTLAAWNNLYVGMNRPEEEMINGKEITIFPNPANNMLFITMGRRNATLIRVFDTQGKTVDTINNPQRHKSLQYNTENLKSDSYFLVFYDHNGREIESHKVIIRK